MLSGLSPSLKVILAIQFVLAALFFALGWSHTASLRFGRSPAAIDIIALAAPVALVLAGTVLAASFARRGKAGAAQLFALAPLPLAILLAMLVGVV